MDVRSEDAAGSPRRRGARALLRVLVALCVVAGLGLSAGTAPGPASPDLRTASVADPVPPTGVTATPGDRQLALSWTASPEAFVSGYNVYFDGVLKTNATGTSTTVTGLVNGRTYVVTIRTVTNFFGTSEGTTASTPLPAVPKDSVPPARPTALTATPADRQVTLSWGANGETDLKHYRLSRGGVLLMTGTARSFVDTGLTNGVSYSYSLVAVDTSDNDSPAATVSTIPRDEVAPAAPTGLSAAPADRQVTLSWNPNGESDIKHYELSRNGAPVATVTGTSSTATGLVNGTQYTWSLVAVDTSGNVSPAVTVSATPRDGMAPAAPVGFAATPGDRQVTLSWTASGESDRKEYRLSRDGEPLVTLTGTFYVDPGLTNGVTYGYSLVAVDTSDNDSATATLSATPRDAVSPEEPAGLTAVPGDRLVTLSWTASGDSDLDHYRLERDGVVLTTLTETTYEDSGLTNGELYEYELVAVDDSGNVSTVATASAVPRDTVAPAEPTSFAAAGDDGVVRLTWDAAGESDLRHYELSRDGVVIATLTDTSYDDSGLTNGDLYEYELVAVDTSGNSSSPAQASATPRDAVAPAEPTGFAAVGDDGVVHLTWDAAGESDLRHYRLSRDGVVIATLTDTSYEDPGLTNGTTYGYELVAVDTSGNVSTPATTSGTPVDAVAPAEPTGLPAVGDDGMVRLSWDAAGESDLRHYELFRDGALVATLAGTTYEDPGLTNGTTYGYELVAVDTSGNVSQPASASATPEDVTAPAEPTGFTAVSGDGVVQLSWDANGEADLEHYELFRDGVLVATLSDTAYDDTGLTNGITYTYELVAVDDDGNASTAASCLGEPTTDAPPAAPTDVRATAGDGQAVLRWTAVPEPDVVEYRVLDENGDQVATVAAPAVSARVTGLANGTSYTVTVVAVDAGGNVSVPSDAVAVVPVPAAVPVEGAGQTGGLAASGDGRFVVIGTRARREASDVNTAYELYLLDRTAGTARRIAPLPARAIGATDPTNTSAPAISDDGRYVALATTAALVPTDTNRLSDVYRLDTDTGIWSLVSVPAGKGVSPSVAGTVRQTASSVYATSPPVVMSADGNVVLFYSARSDLAAKDTNAAVDVFAKDMRTGAVTRVSATAEGTNLPRKAAGPALALTPDGRYALFPAAASTGQVVLYRKTLSGAGAGEAVVVSTVTTAGRTSEFGVFRDMGDVAISDDGRFVALVTAAKIGTTTPTASWTTGLAYRKDTVSGALVALGSGQRTIWEHQVELDPTGRYAFFATAARALPGDANGHTDHYRRDLDGGTAGPLVLVTANAAGSATTGPTGAVAAPEYGRLLAVSGDEVLLTTSQALVARDTNKIRDAYAKDVAGGGIESPLG